jgi:hypothetical protein
MLLGNVDVPAALLGDWSAHDFDCGLRECRARAQRRALDGATRLRDASDRRPNQRLTHDALWRLRPGLE